MNLQASWHSPAASLLVPRHFHCGLVKLSDPSSNNRNPIHSTVRQFCEQCDSEDPLNVAESVNEEEEEGENVVGSLETKQTKSGAKPTKSKSIKQKKQVEESSQHSTSGNIINILPLTNSTRGSKHNKQVDKVIQPIEVNSTINGDMRPVTSIQIKEYLQKNDISFTNGHTCYITTCPRYVRRRMTIKQMNKLFINMTTGTF
jgi:ABC-type proline/glycine betaine transport system ATPase subunit